MNHMSDCAVREASDCTPVISCRYWQGNAKFCSACSQGLFIPSAQHTAIHCLTQNHRFCSYYHEFMEYKALNRDSHAALREPSGQRRRGRYRLWD